MKLPRAELATVPERKLTAYLLAVEHEAGGSKARFFLQFGFTLRNWRQLAQCLKRHALENDVTSVRWIAQGQLYVVDGAILTPTGRRPHVRTIWMVRHDEDTPSLATAYPLWRRSP